MEGAVVGVVVGVAGGRGGRGSKKSNLHRVVVAEGTAVAVAVDGSSASRGGGKRGQGQGQGECPPGNFCLRHAHLHRYNGVESAVLDEEDAVVAEAITMKLDGLKLEMETETDNKAKKGVDDNAGRWKADVDLDFCAVHGPGHTRHRCSRGGRLRRRSRRSSTDVHGHGHGHGHHKAGGDELNFDMDAAIRQLEAENEELATKNNLIRLKNELLMANITESRLEIQRMHWEMIEMSETLDNHLEAHFLEDHCCQQMRDVANAGMIFEETGQKQKASKKKRK